MGIYRYTIREVVDIDKIDVGASSYAYLAAKDKLEFDEGDGISILISDSLASRLYDGQFLGYLLKNYQDRYDWEYGRTYFERLPFLVLPYFLYTERPIMQVPLDKWFPLLLGGSCPSTFIGEIFVNFSYFGIPLICFFMGVILGLYDRIFFAHCNSQMAIAIFCCFSAVTPFMVTQSLASWLGMLRNALLLLLVFHVMRGRPLLRSRTAGIN